MIRILGIESSCDETAASVVENGKKVRSAAVASQIAKHAPYGGVIPELAAREHLTAIRTVVDSALNEAGVEPSQLDAVAVTHAPGLVPALLVGVHFAKGFSAAHHLPLIGINHVLAHLYATFLEDDDLSFSDPTLYPLLALVVSGGHSQLVLIDATATMRLIGTTLDDAAGEAFDKAAKLLNLGYPGGPVIENAARNGNPAKYHFPRSLTGTAGKGVSPENRFNFSFSGLKTALLYHTRDLGGPDALTGQLLADTLASYQEAIVDVLCRKALDAAQFHGAKTMILCGGVACNSALRARFLSLGSDSLRTVAAQKKFCTDNAAMVAGLAYPHFLRGEFATLSLDAVARLPAAAQMPFCIGDRHDRV